MEIKKITKNIKMLTEEDLAILIPAAQKGDDYAMEQICLCFSPLIYKISHRQTVYNVLGEEAVNILWVWFLETIHSYTGNDFRKFPGFVRKHLVLRLMNIFKYYNIRFNSEQLSTMDEDTSVVEIPAGDEYGNLLDKLSLEEQNAELHKQISKLKDIKLSSMEDKLNRTIEMLLSLQESVVENRAISYAVGDTICGSERFKAYVEKAKESINNG